VPGWLCARRRFAITFVLLLAHLAPAIGATDTRLSSETLGHLSAGRAVIATGGGTSSGGIYSIEGTTGQADVDPLQPSTGGVFSITGGFWFAVVPRPDSLFDDGFEGP